MGWHMKTFMTTMLAMVLISTGISNAEGKMSAGEDNKNSKK